MNSFAHFQDKIEPGMIAVIGIPYDENSSFMRGSALAPDRIREVLHSGSTNFCTEDGIDLQSEPRFHDLGNLELTKGLAVLKQIEDAITTLITRDIYVLSLGGDHTVTHPIIKSYSRKYSPLTILHLDAHPDLYEEFEGNRYSHACPFARIMEEGLATRLIQVGIRTMTPHQLTQSKRFGVEVIEMRHWNPHIRLNLEGPVYLSLDMDVLDPGFAPGVSHYEPGGLSPREVLQMLQGIRVPIVGADIVEFNPKRDPSEVTAMVAVKFLKEIAGKMIEHI